MMTALAIHTTTLVFQLKTANLLVIARYMYMYSTLLTTHSNRIHTNAQLLHHYTHTDNCVYVYLYM